MHDRRKRVLDAFAHRTPDRTPLFELYQPCHPVFWNVCGRGVMTDMAMTWDAMEAGISFGELVEAEAHAKVDMAGFFGLDIMHVVTENRRRDFPRPTRTGSSNWLREGREYALDEKRGLIFPVHPETSLHGMIDEERWRIDVESWDGKAPAIPGEETAVFRRVKEIAAERGLDIMFMMEQGAGTAPAFWPPFQLMMLYEEPELLLRWIERQAAEGFAITRAFLEAGVDIVAMGGDTACDKGPFIRPEHYREFILPTIQQHIQLIHDHDALAVYTSDGNLWELKQDIFHESGADGYKEVDFGAGMTMERLIDEGVKDHICILGNVDARHTLCNKAPADVRAFVRHCLELGLRSPGGHILHASHSVHEDVKVENYIALVDAYREFFGLEKLDL